MEIVRRLQKRHEGAYKTILSKRLMLKRVSCASILAVVKIVCNSKEGGTTMKHTKDRKRRAARRIVAAAIIPTLFTASVQAAVLTNIEGVVLVNRGDSFRTASIGASLEPGTRIRAENGSARLVYENGCSVEIGPHQVVLVTSSPPACGGAASVNNGVAESAGLSTSTLVLGGVGVAAAAGLAVALSGSDHGKQLSP